MWRGRDLLIEQGCMDAFQHFNKAFAVIKSLLETNRSGFLLEFFEMLLDFQLEERFDILGALLCFIAEMAKSKSGLHNTVSRIAERPF